MSPSAFSLSSYSLSHPHNNNSYNHHHHSSCSPPSSSSSFSYSSSARPRSSLALISSMDLPHQHRYQDHSSAKVFFESCLDTFESIPTAPPPQHYPSPSA